MMSKFRWNVPLFYCDKPVPTVGCMENPGGCIVKRIGKDGKEWLLYTRYSKEANDSLRFPQIGKTELESRIKKQEWL